MAYTRRSFLALMLIGLLTAVLITILGMLLIAAIAVYMRMSDTLLQTLNQLLKAGAVICGTLRAVPRGGSRGFLSGWLLALVYAVAGYALYVLLGGGSFTAAGMLGDMLLLSAVGAITGAVRANLNRASA